MALVRNVGPLAGCPSRGGWCLLNGSGRAAGFTLVESLMGITLVAIAGTALLTAAANAIQVSTALTNTCVAHGMAEQLLAELSAVPFPSTTSTRPPAGSSRSTFDDLDDFGGWNASPPVDRYGRTLGTEGVVVGASATRRASALQGPALYLNRFRQQILVESVQPAGTGTGWTATSQPTDWRRVTVTVSFLDGRNVSQPLAVKSRIFARTSAAP